VRDLVFKELFEFDIDLKAAEAARASSTLSRSLPVDVKSEKFTEGLDKGRTLRHWLLR